MSFSMIAFLLLRAEEVLEVSAREALRCLSDDSEVNVGSERLVLCVYLEDILSALDIGISDNYLSVESTRTQERRVEYIAAVSCGDNDNAFIACEAVHFYEELI